MGCYVWKEPRHNAQDCTDKIGGPERAFTQEKKEQWLKDPVIKRLQPRTSQPARGGFIRGSPRNLKAPTPKRSGVYSVYSGSKFLFCSILKFIERGTTGTEILKDFPFFEEKLPYKGLPQCGYRKN